MQIFVNKRKMAKEKLFVPFLMFAQWGQKILHLKFEYIFFLYKIEKELTNTSLGKERVIRNNANTILEIEKKIKWRIIGSLLKISMECKWNIL